MDWRDRSLCRDEDPELFFPIGTGEAADRQADEAKSVCLGCPVVDECFAWAIDHHVTDGVWGGQTYAERQATVKRLRRHAERLAS